MFTTVSALRDPWEAHMLCGRLIAEGIPAMVEHEFHVGNNWAISTALGGVKVQVPWYWQEEAETIDGLCRDGFYKAELVREFGDLDDVRCPHCGGAEYRKRRPFPRATAAVTFSLFAGTVLPPVGWIYHCEACKQEYHYALCPVGIGRWAKVFVVSAFGTLIASFAAYIIWSGFPLIVGNKVGLIGVVMALLIAARWGARRFLSEPGETS